MKVKDCMTKTIYACKPETTLQDVAKTMNTNHVGCIPICDNSNNLVGLVTDRDIVLRGVAFGKDIKTTPISEVMTTKLYCCDANDEISAAERLMSNWQVKRVPVTDNNKIIGIVTVENIVNNNSIDQDRAYKAIEGIYHNGINPKNAE